MILSTHAAPDAFREWNHDPASVMAEADTATPISCTKNLSPVSCYFHVLQLSASTLIWLRARHHWKNSSTVSSHIKAYLVQSVSRQGSSSCCHNVGNDEHDLSRRANGA